jgi:UDP-N-acetylglucosamine acyltransferase
MSEATIAEQAVVSPQAVIGKNVSIAPFSVIEAGVTIGDNTKIGPHCHIRNSVTIEDNCTIEAGAKIGILPKGVQVDNDTGVIICQNATIGENATIERSSKNGLRTIVGQNSWVLPTAHVGHNSELGRFVYLTNGVMLAGYVRVGDFANIGAGAGVHQFCSIGERAFIGGFAKISKDVIPYAWVAHKDRTRVYGLNDIGMKRSGMRPEQIENAKKAYAALKQTGTLDDRLHWLSVLDTGESKTIASFLQKSTRGTYIVESNCCINPTSLYRNKDAYLSNNGGKKDY